MDRSPAREKKVGFLPLPKKTAHLQEAIMATLPIVSGPCLFSFANAMFDAEIVGSRVLHFKMEPQRFHVASAETVDPIFRKLVDDMLAARGPTTSTFALTLNGVKLEDGSRKRFMFEGYGAEHQKGLRVRGYYDIETRSGWIEVVK
jgi:hypothetical protein